MKSHSSPIQAENNESPLQVYRKELFDLAQKGLIYFVGVQHFSSPSTKDRREIYNPKYEVPENAGVLDDDKLCVEAYSNKPRTYKDQHAQLIAAPLTSLELKRAQEAYQELVDYISKQSVPLYSLKEDWSEVPEHKNDLILFNPTTQKHEVWIQKAEPLFAAIQRLSDGFKKAAFRL